MAKPDVEIWMVDLDGTGSMHPASKGDPEAISYTRTDTLPTWQPIETAPRDGTEVLILLHSGDICNSWFARGEWSFSTMDGPPEYSGDCWVCCDDRFQVEVTDEGAGSYDDGEATHWMPHPTPPKGDTHD